MKTRVHKGFTLIELLIVVAIIAILAAIAVPNFLEAQTRAKVSRVKAEFRTIATGVESYHVDFNAYPSHVDPNGGAGSYQEPWGLIRLTTPVSYLTNVHWVDPFRLAGQRNANLIAGFNYYLYTPLFDDRDGPPYIGLRNLYRKWLSTNPAVFPYYNGKFLDENNFYNQFSWMVHSYGPDQFNSIDNDANVPPELRTALWEIFLPYDPTNGTTSYGDIHRMGP